jgi:hypothetical protein
MRDIFSVIGLAMLLSIAGCAKCNCPAFSSEGVECQRLRMLWERAGEENPQIIIPEINTEFGHESGDEMTWQELGEMVFLAAGCCFSKPHPLSNEWMEYNRLDCIWENLERENIQKITFYGGHGGILGPDSEPPEDWHSWSEITEPERIKQVMKLLYKAMKREKDRCVNVDLVMQDTERMQIITDKHKFIIPVSDYDHAIRGIGWTSYELKKKLTEWGFPRPK